MRCRHLHGAIEALRQGVIPGAVERNREYVGEAIRVAPDVDEALVNLGFDAQTSGGLLIAVPAERLETLRQALARRGAGGFVIGRIDGRRRTNLLSVRHSATRPEFRRLQTVGRKPNSTRKSKSMKSSDSTRTSHPSDEGHGCCADTVQGRRRGEFRRRNAKGFRRADPLGAGGRRH